MSASERYLCLLSKEVMCGFIKGNGWRGERGSICFLDLAAWRLGVGHGIFVVIPNAGCDLAGLSQKNH